MRGINIYLILEMVKYKTMSLFNIIRQNKKTNKRQKLNFNELHWLEISNNEICPFICTEEWANYYLNQLSRSDETQYYYFKCLNTIQKRKCKIAWIGDNTGNNGDLNDELHKGFTIGKGRAMYWMMLWHKSGNVSVFGMHNDSRRYLSGDQEITIHFK